VRRTWCSGPVQQEPRDRGAGAGAGAGPGAGGGAGSGAQPGWFGCRALHRGRWRRCGGGRRERHQQHPASSQEAKAPARPRAGDEGHGSSPPVRVGFPAVRSKGPERFGREASTRSSWAGACSAAATPERRRVCGACAGCRAPRRALGHASSWSARSFPSWPEPATRLSGRGDDPRATLATRLHPGRWALASRCPCPRSFSARDSPAGGSVCATLGKALVGARGRAGGRVSGTTCPADRRQRRRFGRARCVASSAGLTCWIGGVR
jgi:hypothetical protein